MNIISDKSHVIGTIRHWTVVKALDISGNVSIYIKGNLFNDSREWVDDNTLIITAPVLEGGNGNVVTMEGIYQLG